MNSHIPFDADNDWTLDPYHCNQSNDPLVDKVIGNAYAVVRAVYCNLGNLKLLYDFLNTYGMVLGVKSEAELKKLNKLAKYARIYGYASTGDRQVTDYLYVPDDASGIRPDDPTATGSWIKVATSETGGGGEGGGQGAYIPYVYANGSALGGETSFKVPDGTIGVPFLIINGSVQYIGFGFTYSAATATVTLSNPLVQGDEVIALTTAIPANPDNPEVPGWVQVNWLYNNGSAVGGEQVITVPYNFQDVPAVYKNGLRLYKGLQSNSYVIDPDTHTITMTEILAQGDRVIVTLGGESETLTVTDRTLQEVARATNVPDSSVVLSTSTNVVITNKKVLYDVSAQKYWGLPDLPPNAYIVKVDGDKLTYNPGNVTVDLLPYNERSVQEVARSFNVPDSAVILSNDYVSTLNGKTVLFDVVEQKAWGIPDGIPTGSTIVGLSEGVLLYKTGTTQTNVALTVPPNSAQSVDEKYNAHRFNGKADYKGVPLYDGNDSSRITATDNSPVLADLFAKGKVDPDGVLHIHVPAGHYGFKTPEILINPSLRPDVVSVLISGDGMGVSILDFIYERTDGTSVVPDTATVLIRGTSIPVNTQDITLKCTTKRGVVRGSASPAPDNPDVYNGAVWFMHLQDVPKLRTVRTEVSHANFRGISVDAQNLPIYSRTKWSIIDCEGHDNTSTGFWGSFLTSMHTSGGRFYHNGTQGLLGTGYGIAASQYIDHCLITGGEFFENYRKGYDRHGGVGTLTVHGAYFADNLLRDIEDNKQYNSQYVSDLNDVIVSNSTFLLNNNQAWLKNALAAVQAAGGSLSCFKTFISVLDRNINGTIAGKQKRVSISNCTFKVVGSVPDGYQGFGAFNLEAPLSEFENVVFDSTGFRFADVVQGNVYQSYWAAVGAHDNAVVRLKNCTIKTHPGSINHPTTGEASNSVFMTVGTSTVVEAYDTLIELTNFVPFAVTGSGNVSPANGLTRKFYRSTWLYRNMRLRTQQATTTNSLTWVNSGYGIKGTTGNDIYQDCFVGYGDAKVLAPLNNSLGMGGKQSFQINAATKAIGAVQTMLTTANSNLHVTMQGALELNADQHRSGFRYSTWTQTVYTGSSYVAFERLGTEAIKYNGADTNFIASKLQARFVVASPSDTGFYNGELSCSDWATQLIVG